MRRKIAKRLKREIVKMGAVILKTDGQFREKAFREKRTATSSKSCIGAGPYSQPVTMNWIPSE